MKASSPAETTPDLDSRALAALAKSRNFASEHLRLLLGLKEMILHAMGLVLGQWRDSRDPVTGAFAEHCQSDIKVLELRDAFEILHGRFRRMPPAQRKRYSPEERFRIVTFVRTYGLSHTQAAERFLVDPHTIARWISEATREPDKETVGSLLRATPPVRSYDDVTRQLVALLDDLGIGGSKKIGQTLVRAGRKVSTEFVRRVRKSRVSAGPRPTDPRRDRSETVLALRAKHPNHVWMTDITSVPTFLRIWCLKLVVVLDVFSRFPLAFKVFTKEPSSEEIAAMVGAAAERYGKPEHFVTDRGRQFTGNAFVSRLADLGVRRRFGAIGQSGSIAIIERFWRTLKELIDARFLPPLSPLHLADKVAVALEYYATLRPHQGLNGATPAEMYFGLTPLTTLARTPPRAASRDPSGPSAIDDLPFVVSHVDPEKRLPFLYPNRRAA